MALSRCWLPHKPRLRRAAARKRGNAATESRSVNPTRLLIFLMGRLQFIALAGLRQRARCVEEAVHFRAAEAVHALQHGKRTTRC